MSKKSKKQAEEKKPSPSNEFQETDKSKPQKTGKIAESKVEDGKEPKFEDILFKDQRLEEDLEREAIWLITEARQMLEGEWYVETPTDTDPEEWDIEEEESEYSVYVLQDEDMPYRFHGISSRVEHDDTYDLRLAPMGHEPSASPTDERSWSIFFTFEEDTPEGICFGGGILYPTGDGELTGIKLEHRGEDQPLRWVKVSDEVPEGVREILEDDNLDPLDMLMSMMAPNALENVFMADTATLEKLASGGIKTAEQLKAATDEQLLAIKGIGPATLDKIRRRMEQLGLVDEDEHIYEINHDQLKRVFRFRVSLDQRKGIWRDIEMLGEHSLHNLHEMIQVAFDWDDDHLYSFFMSGRYWDGSTAISHPVAGDEDASEVVIAALSLQPKSKFVYIFDFGDEWRHVIEVQDISTEPVAPNKEDEYPKISQSKGKAPEQYPAWDDE